MVEVPGIKPEKEKLIVKHADYSVSEVDLQNQWQSSITIVLSMVFKNLCFLSYSRELQISYRHKEVLVKVSITLK